MNPVTDVLPITILNEQPVSITYYEPIFGGEEEQLITDFKLCYCNRAAATFAGATTEELLWQRLSNSPFLDSATKDLTLHQLRNVFTGGGTIETDLYNKALKKYFCIRHSRVSDGVMSIAEDITEEVERKRKKEREEKLAATILDSGLNGWFYCEAVRDRHNVIEDFRFIMVNGLFRQLLGFSDHNFIGRTHLELFPASRNNGVHDLNCRVVNNKVAERKLMEYKGDNLNAWYDVLASPIGEDGLLVTFADITHTKKKEIEAAALADTLSTVVNTAQVGIFTLFPEYNDNGNIIDFRFRMVNTALASYVAQEPDSLVGALASEWFPGYLQMGIFDMYVDSYNSGQSARKNFHYNAHGIDVYLDIQSTRIGDELLVTFSDFTPLQIAQLELQKIIRELRRSNQNLQEFTRAASHDLKEPIRKIQLFSDRLKQNLTNSLNDNTADLFSRMENAAMRMRMLIDDLLEYSQVSSNGGDYDMVDLNEVLGYVVSDLELMIEETDAVVEYAGLPRINANRRQMQQLFLNLINNAIKYRRDGINPHVYIYADVILGRDSGLDLAESEFDREFICIKVCDNGIGFNPADSEKIFHVFTRLHNNNDYAGTGIGLAIASRVMENHSGYIYATGVKGQGATFTLLFPSMANLSG